MAHETNNVKQFLDKEGLQLLWERIYNGFAPRWQSYKPSNTSSTSEDRLPADFINVYEGDYMVGGTPDGRKSVNITFISAGPIKDTAGNEYGRDLVIQIPEVKAPSNDGTTTGSYGVMSPADKSKLDNISNTAETLITIKGVKVKDNELTLDNKFVNWDLVYNANSNTLDIVDLNSSSNVMTSVSVDDMLSDAIKKGFLSDVSLVDKKDGETEASGLYLKFIFTTGIGSNGISDESQTIYVDVKDLVDVYEAGEGISITQGTYDTANQTARSSTISLKTSSTSVIGGVKIYKDNSSYSVEARTGDVSANVTGTAHRNFGVEIDKNDKAFVNVPITNITINDPATAITDTTVSPVTGGTFNIINDYNATKSTDGDGWVISPSTATVTVSKETSWSTTGNSGEAGKTLNFGDSFIVFKDITASGTNGHVGNKTNTTFTLPTETKLSLADPSSGADNNLTTSYENKTETINGVTDVPVSHQTVSFVTSKVKSVDDHTIVCEETTNSFDICIPTINTDFINSLQYRIQ